MTVLSVSEAAQAVGLTTYTLRWYEQEGGRVRNLRGTGSGTDEVLTRLIGRSIRCCSDSKYQPCYQYSHAITQHVVSICPTDNGTAGQ
jgi:hypothetical protein